MLEELHLVAEDGRAVAVFYAGPERRSALADALSWYVTRRFQAPELDAEAVLELRAAGALADRIDLFRGSEDRALVRVNADEVRLLIEASWALIAERDSAGYHPPEERTRVDELVGLSDPLFDLVAELDRADTVLG